MSTSKEPEYTYVKGQGWVVASAFKTLTFDKGDGWTMICENRAPTAGELFFIERDFERTARNLSMQHWSVNRMQLHASAYFRKAPYYTGNPVKDGCCVVRLVKT